MSLTSTTDSLAVIGDSSGAGVTPGAIPANAGSYAKRDSAGGLAMANCNATGTNAAGNRKTTGAAISASTTLTASSPGWSEVDATAAEVDLTLPAVSTVPGQIFELVKIDSSGHAAKFVAAGSDPLNGSAGGNVSTTTQWGVLRVRANQAGTAWYNA